MHIYSAYGLRIASEIPLVELVPEKSGPIDASVRYLENRTAGDWIQDVAGREYHLAIDPGHARFWFQDAGGFVVRGGTTIEVIPVAGADENLIRLYIEGMITAMLLHQRGMCVLHASVVEIDSRAVAFLGPVGAGKSSLAAAMHARGHTLISDDNAAIRLAGNNAIVAPAYPYLKLFPAIAQTLGYKNGDLRVLHSSLKKIAGSATRNFKFQPQKLARLYFLRRERAPEIQPIEASRLIVELIRNSVPTRWGAPGDAEHLQRCAAVAQRVEAFTVGTFETPEALPELAERIVEHCSARSAAGAAAELV